MGRVSLCELTALRAALAQSEALGGVLAQSGAFGRRPSEEPDAAWVVRQVERAPRRLLRVHLEAGTREPAILAANRRLRDVLRAKGYPVHFAEFCGGHDYACWRGTLADGLLARLGQPSGGPPRLPPEAEPAPAPRRFSWRTE